MTTNINIETRVVEVPGAGTFFRREWKTPDGESLRVEYLPVVYGDVVVMPEPEDSVAAAADEE